MTDNVPTPHPEDQQDTYTDLTARLAAADLDWSHEHGDPPASPDYIKRLAFQVMAFKPPLIAGVYVDDEMLDDMRDRLHGDNCGCGEWDSHSQEYVERMDETIRAVLYPLRHPARPVPRGTEGSDYREQIARALLASSDSRTDLSGTHDIQIIPADAAADLYERFVSPLVEQLRQARAEAEQWRATFGETALADHVAEVDQLRAASSKFDERISDLQAEYAKHYAAWEKQHARLTGERRLLLWLHAEAVWRLGEAVELADEAVPYAGDYFDQKWHLSVRLAEMESWRAAPVVEFEAADSPSPVSKSSQTAAPAEAETPARPIGMVYLLDQYDRLLSAVEHIRMDTPEDRDRHARVIATFRRAAEPVREQVEGAALPEVEITDEHVREHDDAASTRDEVVEAWAATWDGDDRTPEWVRVVEPCPVPDCAIPQVHGHEGYGLRFTPAAQPEPQGEPDEDWCGRFADDGKHYCPEGHNTVYQMFSGGREWYCADCGTQGTYPPAPADVGPRARLLTQSGGAAELKRQMDKHLAHPDEETPND